MGKIIKPFLLFLLAILVFHSWFFPGVLSTFDFPYYSSLMMKDANIIPYAWGWHIGFDGFAKFFSPYSWVFPLIYIPQVIFGNLLRMDWPFITRIMYLYPYLIFMIVSPILLIRYIFPKNQYYLLAVFIFLFNTYGLMLAGGEIFLALAYALAPIILMIFLKIADSKQQRADNKEQKADIRYSIIAGLLLSVQIMFDPRIAYVTLSIVGLFLFFAFCYLLSVKKMNIFFNLIFYALVIPLGITVLLHAFWIIPSILHGGNPVETLGSAYSTVGAINYLSFAKFEHAISLLQPNWPENIFGKVGFMKPEFLLLPVLAFASLLFVNKLKEGREKLYILFFAFLGLVGTFLSKGSNDPFGGIYLWMFRYIPGFIMFRDPTKWYLLVALAYAILIPFSVWNICDWLKLQSKFLIKSKVFNLQNAFLFFVICYLLFLIRPAILGQLGGMFKITSVPEDYVRLEKFLANQQDYFRTLWVPFETAFWLLFKSPSGNIRADII